ncbi:MBL fold metallo-hydrolase [Corynebacterium aurimucosum]|uniref:MBL fold metallo-hydrolase n=1 Tax=Corynebacterium aurimucosum TaxID=169292 RepID=UPI0018795316|nr:MBL fold metallo-hydrolase [Corynebacterium aurimucosum]MBE7339180.1 MBL fold metallo-hydrolase [Corynebacterium aurimucosum]
MNTPDIYGFAAGPYKTNTYVVANGSRAFIVDPGMHTRERLALLEREKSLEFEAVVLTHGHIDHTRDAAEFDLPVYIHPDDAFMLVDGSGVSPESQMLFAAASMKQVADRRDLLGGETLSLVGLEFELLHAPGHSPGCVMLVAEDFALTGDVLFKGSIGRTDLPHSDPAAMQRSLRGPVWGLVDSLAILPGHGPTSTMRRERATNPFLRAAGDVL